MQTKDHSEECWRFKQGLSHRGPQRVRSHPCEPCHCSVYKAKLLAHRRAVLSDKSLKPHSKKNKKIVVGGGRQPPEALLRY